MGLRPARTIRVPRGQPWARISTKRPRKSFVKGAPNPKVRQYNMGSDKRYELECTLVSEQNIHLRDNSIEAARQTANRYLEGNLIQNYFFQVTAFPHLIVREHSALGVAGADRISKGMKLAFGKPKGRMAHLKKGAVLFTSRIMEKDLPVLKRAFELARSKLSGLYSLNIRDIKNDALNISRKEHVFKKKEEPKPEAKTDATAAATAPAGAPAAAAAAPAAGAKPAAK